MATSTTIWDPAPGGAGPVPWARVEASLRLCQRWEHPHLLPHRVAESPRRAAVAVLLWGGPEGARQVVLVRRGASAPQHGGELAFPGGMEEPFDRDLPATARRELAEELGVTGRPLGAGLLPRRGGQGPDPLHPGVPALGGPGTGVPARLGDPGRAACCPWRGSWGPPGRIQDLELRGRSVEVPRLELPMAPLWGATAMVLKTWLDLLSSVRNSMTG